MKISLGVFCLFFAGASAFGGFLGSMFDGVNSVLNKLSANVLKTFQIPNGMVRNIIPWTAFPENEVEFLLYTRNTRQSPARWNGGSNGPDIDPSKPTRVLIHGWLESKDRAWYSKMTNNYFLIGDYNVIQVCWSKRAQNPNYMRSAADTRHVGAIIGQELIKLNLPLNNIHLIGHSLGGHVAGFAGKFIQQHAGGKVDRVTALDPAMPLFEVNKRDERITKDDARVVQVIHTDAFVLGLAKPTGTIDFYPNGGNPPQPGCGALEINKALDAVFSCSHTRSVDFFTESILSHGFVGTACNSYENYKAGRCFSNPRAVMGEHLTENAEGAYFLTTRDREPYALDQ